MNPILERNKSIYRLLLIASAAIGLLSVLLIALLWDVGKALRFYFVMLFLVCIAVVLVAFHRALNNPKRNQPVRFRIFSFRVKREPATNYDDSDGWRYLKTGLSDLLLSLFFLVMAIWLVFYTRVPDFWMWAAEGVILIGDVVLNAWYIKKIESNS